MLSVCFIEVDLVQEAVWRKSLGDEGNVRWYRFGLARYPVEFFRDDFRRCTDSEDYPLNLMLFAGLPEDGWRDYFYTSLAELTAPDKALARWLAGALD